MRDARPYRIARGPLGAAAALLAATTGVAALAVPPVAVAAVAFSACWLAALGAAHLLARALGRR